MDKRANFNIEKEKVLENTLCYVNRTYYFIVKVGELAIYNRNFILGQLVIAANQPYKIDKYVCKKNQVKLTVYLYDKLTGEFLGLDLHLAYIILLGDIEESFFSYGYNNKKSKVLYSAAIDRIPNAIISTCFKKYFHEIINERQHNEESSGLFFTYHQLLTEKRPSINITIM